VGLKESLLILTEIELSSDYKSKEKTGTGSALPLYTSLSPTLLLLSLISNDFLPFHYNIS